eukprot:scpid77391/ scgid28884/ 
MEAVVVKPVKTVAKRDSSKADKDADDDVFDSVDVLNKARLLSMGGDDMLQGLESWLNECSTVTGRVASIPDVLHPDKATTPTTDLLLSILDGKKQADAADMAGDGNMFDVYARLLNNASIPSLSGSGAGADLNYSSRTSLSLSSYLPNTGPMAASQDPLGHQLPSMPNYQMESTQVPNTQIRYGVPGFLPSNTLSSQQQQQRQQQQPTLLQNRSDPTHNTNDPQDSRSTKDGRTSPGSQESQSTASNTHPQQEFSELAENQKDLFEELMSEAGTIPAEPHQHYPWVQLPGEGNPNLYPLVGVKPAPTLPLPSMHYSPYGLPPAMASSAEQAMSQVPLQQQDRPPHPIAYSSPYSRLPAPPLAYMPSAYHHPMYHHHPHPYMPPNYPPMAAQHQAAAAAALMAQAAALAQGSYLPAPVHHPFSGFASAKAPTPAEYEKAVKEHLQRIKLSPHRPPTTMSRALSMKASISKKIKPTIKRASSQKAANRYIVPEAAAEKSTLMYTPTSVVAALESTTVDSVTSTNANAASATVTTPIASKTAISRHKKLLRPAKRFMQNLRS